MPTPSDAHASPLSRWAATLTIVLTLLGWSSIPLFLKHFSHDIDFWTANGWRYAFSAVLWAPVLVLGFFRRDLPPNLWRAAIVPGVFNALGQLLFGWAPYLIDPGLMTFSLRVQIVFVAIGAAILFPLERALLKRPAFLLGMGVVFGATLVTIALKPAGVGHDAAVPEGSRVVLGVIVAVGSGLAYAIYALAVRRSMHGMPAFTAFAAVSQYTAALLVVPMLIFGKDHGAHALDLPASQFGLLLLSSLVGIGLGHTMYFFSIARLGVAVSSGVVQLQPIVVSLFSIRLFDEAFTRAQWISGGVAIAGAMWMLYVQHSHATKARNAAVREPSLDVEACAQCGYELAPGVTAPCPKCGNGPDRQAS